MLEINRIQLGYAPVFVPFNQGSDYLHQRGERMGLVFADFVDQGRALPDRPTPRGDPGSG